MKRSSTLLAAGIATVLLVGFAYLVFLNFERGTIQVADYQDFSFRGTDGLFSEVSVGHLREPEVPAPSTTRLWIKIGSAPAKPIVEVQMIDVKSTFPEVREVELDDRTFTVIEDDASSSAFWFLDGDLVYANIDDRKIRLRGDGSGDYLRFPIPRKQLVDTFGEPQWKQERISAP